MCCEMFVAGDFIKLFLGLLLIQTEISPQSVAVIVIICGCITCRDFILTHNACHFSLRPFRANSGRASVRRYSSLPCVGVYAFYLVQHEYIVVNVFSLTIFKESAGNVFASTRRHASRLTYVLSIARRSSVSWASRREVSSDSFQEK
jgi:hypothetical protein